MAEPNQTLPQSDSEGREEETSRPCLEDMIETSIGNFGWNQLLQSLLVSFSMFFDSQQAFISIFTDSHPPWHCTTNNLTTCNPKTSDICKIPRSYWAWDNGLTSTTIISQWSLQCSSSLITGLPQSSFFIGCWLGGFLLSTFPDSSLGRKNMLFLSCLTMSISSTVIVFSTNVWVYSAFKFLIGFCRSSIGTCSLVLLTERVQKEWRFRVGVLEYIWFTLGFMSLPGIAYVNRDSSWKSLYLWTSLPGIFYSLFAYIFVSESPRWLLMQGREKEAMAILKGTVNSSSQLTAPAQQQQKSASTSNFCSSIRELYEKKWALKQLLAVIVLGFGIGMVYFGMPLNVGNLGLNIYLNTLFNALLDIPALIATYLLDNFRRKPSILGFSIASGISCLICAVIRNELLTVKLGFALVSFFSVGTSFNVFLIYVIELFPTSVRNIATSMARQAIVFGAIFSPYLISEGRKNDFFSYGVFGVTMLCSASCILCLAETRGIALCDTMDQQERKESINNA